MSEPVPSGTQKSVAPEPSPAPADDEQLRLAQRQGYEAGAMDEAAKIAEVRGEKSFACDLDNVHRRAAIRYPIAPAPSSPPRAAPTTTEKIREANKALSCLYIAVEESVARDVQAKCQVAIGSLVIDNANLRAQRDQAYQDRADIEAERTEIAVRMYKCAEEHGLLNRATKPSESVAIGFRETRAELDEALSRNASLTVCSCGKSLSPPRCNVCDNDE